MRLMFGRTDRSRRVLEARRKCSCQNMRTLKSDYTQRAAVEREVTQEHRDVQLVAVDGAAPVRVDLVEAAAAGVGEGPARLGVDPAEGEDRGDAGERGEKMLEISKELYEYFHNGKKGKDATNLRMLRE